MSVVFDDELRALTESVAADVHDLLRSGVTPPPVRGKGCAACSLRELCLARAPSARAWVANQLDRIVWGET